MRCSKCQYDHLPNNINLLVAHAQLELMEGKFAEVPKVVWRDGHFVLVDAPEEDEPTYEIVIKDPRVVEEEFYNEELFEKERKEAEEASKEESE